MTRKFAGREVTEEWLSVNQLNIPTEYQRPLRVNTVDKIIRDFDPDAIGVLYVSERADGTKVLIDGQQRRAAVTRCLGPDQKVPCHVYHDLTREQEAALFVKYNAGATRPNAYELHRARVVAGDEDAIGMQKVIESRGFYFARSGNQPKVIQSVQAVTRIYSRSPKLLEMTLDVCLEAGIGRDEGLHGNFMEGVARLIARYGHEVDLARLGTVIQGVQRRVLNTARGMKSEVSGWDRLDILISHLLLDQYNRGLKTRRVEWVPPNSNNAWKPVQRD